MKLGFNVHMYYALSGFIAYPLPLCA